MIAGRESALILQISEEDGEFALGLVSRRTRSRIGSARGGWRVITASAGRIARRLRRRKGGRRGQRMSQ